MSVREILVARHGETQWNHIRRWQGISDIPLNENGIMQARKLGESLAGQGITRVYSSDLQRAVSTARIVSEIIKSGQVSIDERIRERGLGKFEGWHSRDVARFLGIPEEQAHILETDERSIEGAPDVEPWESFVARVWNFLQDISGDASPDKTLIVAHGGVMRAITCTLKNEGFGMPEFKNGQYIRLTVNGNAWEIL